MRTKVEIERSLAEMKRMADDARRGLAIAKEMNATVLVKHFEQWETKCEARAQILSWVLGEQELNEDIQPQLPQASVMRAKGRTVAAPSVEETINRLGECSEGNEYRIYPYAGQWWIDHKHIGSGEPLEQFLRGSYGA